jgi:tripartite-type tricarboxylate transporter receptor subunit TctC
LGQQFYVENIGGAGGNLGMANVARGGDGYTILFSSSSIVVNPSSTGRSHSTSRRISLQSPRPERRRLLAGQQRFLDQRHARADRPAESQPGKLSVGSPDGTTPSSLIEMLKQAFGLSFVTVPFAGGP